MALSTLPVLSLVPRMLQTSITSHAGRLETDNCKIIDWKSDELEGFMCKMKQSTTRRLRQFLIVCSLSCRVVWSAVKGSHQLVRVHVYCDTLHARVCPLRLLEMRSPSKSPCCLHHLLTTPSSFTLTEMCSHQRSGRGDPCCRGQEVNRDDRWCFCLSAHLPAGLSACTDHRRPTCCTRLNKAEEVASRGLLITDVDEWLHQQQQQHFYNPWSQRCNRLRRSDSYPTKANFHLTFNMQCF